MKVYGFSYGNSKGKFTNFGFGNSKKKSLFSMGFSGSLPSRKRENISHQMGKPENHQLKHAISEDKFVTKISGHKPLPSGLVNTLSLGIWCNCAAALTALPQSQESCLLRSKNPLWLTKCAKRKTTKQ